MPSFSVPTGEVGCFWRAASSSWGRVPRVIWLGLEESQGLKKLLSLHRAVGGACVGAGVLFCRAPVPLFVLCCMRGFVLAARARS